MNLESLKNIELNKIRTKVGPRYASLIINDIFLLLSTISVLVRKLKGAVLLERLEHANKLIQFSSYISEGMALLNYSSQKRLVKYYNKYNKTFRSAKYHFYVYGCINF